MSRITDKELDMLIDLHQEKYCESALDYVIEKAAKELKEYRDLNIVYCKDCKHWGTGIVGETENIKCCKYGNYMVGGNGYCVYGENKESEV